ncbi:MAG: hypothetical protein UW85_C0010G0003 [Parcubacteria group bacterium GW2011_GWA1_Parcubacteria_45_10]|nr:MAG: hypothetical protein UW85_C0010G0003 [Parcubacteria group bacterium GW2011_GWA1_Parcubacteria_45_10]KKT88594.1 MAG: hypothetical protein UW89_C0006G0002 [Parcubacteria group bacterium GW2011_GWB1_45_10]
MPIPKKSATIVVYESPDGHVIRECLEACNYRTDVIWIGSREEFLSVLNNPRTTNDIVVIDSHGDPEKGFVTDMEKPVGFDEISALKGLQGKNVVGAACFMGVQGFTEAFKKAGVGSYVGASDNISTPSIILFITTLFYSFTRGSFYPELGDVSWKKAVEEAVQKFKEDSWKPYFTT